MRLADFIEQHMPVVLASWDAFAATLLPAAAGASKATLRDLLRRFEAHAPDADSAQDVIRFNARTP
jgi:hypothetical protein